MIGVLKQKKKKIVSFCLVANYITSWRLSFFVKGDDD